MSIVNISQPALKNSGVSVPPLFSIIAEVRFRDGPLDRPMRQAMIQSISRVAESARQPFSAADGAWCWHPDAGFGSRLRDWWTSGIFAGWNRRA
ncbi:hypothetical protein [Frankia sp. Cppng1_Ct_nod]|uniref:hypothetical protein n=1 Tax=Frankia sp. Cppng1_Ct_nod TaxID=2897162 RepID=UPI0013EF61B1|nr:hypothetical protein [Frankia sp. Cppng1_Ct_nod]